MKKCEYFTVFILLIIFCVPLYASENGDEDGPLEEQAEAYTPPSVIKSVQTSYPDELINKYQEGKVVLRFIVTREGGAADIAVTQSTPAGVFDEYAINAIKGYRFNPATRNGEPIECVVKMPIEFALRDSGTGEEVVTGYDAYKEAETGMTNLNKGAYEQAIEAFSNAVKIYDKYSAAYCGRGIAYIEKGEYLKAMSDFDEAIKLDPDVARYYKYRGRLYAILKDFQKAIDDYGNAIKLDKNMIDAYYYRGYAYRQSGRYKEAIGDYTRVIDQDGKNTDAYVNRGYSYSKLNDMKNTCIDLKKACELGDCIGFSTLQRAGNCVSGNSTIP